MSLTISSRLSDPKRATTDEDLYVLTPRDHLNFVPGIYLVTIISGIAWITLNQRDITLRTGESVALVVKDRHTLVSSLGKETLELSSRRLGL